MSDKDTKNEKEIIKVCIIGAGFSGLCAGVQLKKKLKLVRFTIFEQNTDVGGTWFSNSYPGCGSVIPSHLYSYSFEPNSDWTSVYVRQQEILDYLKHVSKKYKLLKHIIFRALIKRLVWDEDVQKWIVTVLDLDSSQESDHLFNFVINATGQFRTPKLPKDFLNFKGSIMHTAEWDHSMNFSGKTVAVIGSGSSAVQVIPEIAKNAKRLISYQRSPTWVISKLQFRYPEFLKWAFANIPGLRNSYRSLIFMMNELGHVAFQSKTLISSIGNPVGQMLRKIQLRRQIGSNASLRQVLNPTHTFGCKRVCISNEFYPTLDLPHVKVITSKIVQLEERCIISEDGKREDVDIIVFATGFEVLDYFSPMEIFGKDSINIFNKWKSEGPSGYLGTCFSCMPNMFVLQGPGSDILHNTGIFVIECQTKLILKVLKESMRLKARQVCLNSFQEKEYMRKRSESLGKTVWGNSCHSTNSYFKDSLYPQNLISFWWKVKTAHISNLFQFD